MVGARQLCSLWDIHYQMESPEAQFVAMIMCRMHELELTCDLLCQRHADLKAQVENSLHLTGDLCEFSDGFWLDIDYGQRETGRLRCRSPSEELLLTFPLDALHAKATAF